MCRFAPPFEPVSEPQLVRALGIPELRFFAESPLGGEALGAVLAHAAAAVKAGLARTVVVYRALSQSQGRPVRARRRPGTRQARARRGPQRARGGARGGQPVVRLALRPDVARPALRAVGRAGTPSCTASPMRTSPGRSAASPSPSAAYANNNPNAMMRDRKMDWDDYRGARMISEPLRLFDLCLENDGACAYVVTERRRGADGCATTRCTCCPPPRRSARTASRWASTSPASCSSCSRPPPRAAVRRGRGGPG